MDYQILQNLQCEQNHWVPVVQNETGSSSIVTILDVDLGFLYLFDNLSKIGPNIYYLHILIQLLIMNL